LSNTIKEDEMGEACGTYIGEGKKCLQVLVENSKAKEPLARTAALPRIRTYLLPPWCRVLLEKLTGL